MIIDTGESLKRIQCKTCSCKHNTLQIFCKSNNKKYPIGSIDYYATIYKNKCYLIPYVNQKQISLRLIPPKNNQKKSIKFAQDYFIGFII